MIDQFELMNSVIEENRESTLESWSKCLVPGLTDEEAVRFLDPSFSPTKNESSDGASKTKVVGTSEKQVRHNGQKPKPVVAVA